MVAAALGLTIVAMAIRSVRRRGRRAAGRPRRQTRCGSGPRRLRFEAASGFVEAKERASKLTLVLWGLRTTSLRQQRFKTMIWGVLSVSVRVFLLILGGIQQWNPSPLISCPG